jgi:hypothetical protein
MSDLDARIQALEAEIRRLREARFDALKAAYLAGDLPLEEVAVSFGMTRSAVYVVARQYGWPKRRAKTSQETRAKISATLKAKNIRPKTTYVPPRVRPLPGTDEHRLFMKIAYGAGLGAAAAHAELKRGA